MIKAVIFDLYETLVTQSGQTFRAPARWANRSDSMRPPIGANGSSCGRWSCAAN